MTGVTLVLKHVAPPAIPYSGPNWGPNWVPYFGQEKEQRYA